MTGIPRFNYEQAKKHRQKGCAGCDYQSKGKNWKCNYASITGKTRLTAGYETFGTMDGGKLLPEGGCRLKRCSHAGVAQ